MMPKTAVPSQMSSSRSTRTDHPRCATAQLTRSPDRAVSAHNNKDVTVSELRPEDLEATTTRS
jgi:hypothetical protein